MDLKINFIGIGAEKAGTTWLSKMLDQHPEIELSEPKEVQYFNKKSSYIFNFKNRNFNKTFKWYSKHFKHCKNNCVKGEFSTQYLIDKEAPKRIKIKFPDIKIIVCLRNPIDRAYSQYLMYKNYFKKEKRDFEDVVRLEEEYIDKGLYSFHINRWLKYFDKKQIIFLFIEDIKQNPLIEIKKLYKFLEVDDEFIPNKINEKVNSSREINNVLILSLMKYLSQAMILFNLSNVIKKIKESGFKEKIINLSTRKIVYRNMENCTRKYLIKKFIKDIEQLEILFKKDLSKWKR